MANTQPKQPTKTAESPNSENNDGVSNTVDDTDTGGANSTPTKPSIEEVPDNLKSLVNSLMAAARRDGEENGKNKAKTEAEKEADAERQRNLEKNQEFEPLYRDAIGKLEEAEKRATAAERQNLALEVALEKKLPNPHLACKRLIGETREELEEDAKALLKVLKSDESTKPPKKGEGDDPPVTSEGGDDEIPTDEVIQKENDKFNAQRGTNIYNF